MGDKKPLDRDLAALPKAHLHVHLTGSMRPSTLHELADRYDVEVADPPRRFTDWREFYQAYGAGKQVLGSSADLHRLVVEVVEDAAADGAVWIEISVSPSGYRTLTGADEATMEVLADAVDAAAAVTGIGVGLVVAADRVRDAVDPDAMAVLAASWAGRGVVGFGLGGDEAHPCRPFGPAATVAREAGLLMVPHAGELAGPASVRETLDELRPDRILHGVRAVEEPLLVAELAHRGLCLDVCPTSNVALGVVDDLEAHPLPELIGAGVRCSINADDSLVFDTSLRAEYQQARDTLGLSDAELAGTARTSLEASAAPDPVRGRALAAIDAWAADEPADR